MGFRILEADIKEQKLKIGNKRMKKDLGSEVGQCESGKGVYFEYSKFEYSHFEFKVWVFKGVLSKVTQLKEGIYYSVKVLWNPCKKLFKNK